MFALKHLLGENQIMARKKLTDTSIRNYEPAEAGKRYEIVDTEHPRLVLRVTDRGVKSFCYRGRFPGSSNPTRRLIGEYPATPLAEARETARAWDALLAKRIDPASEKKRLADEQERKAREAALASANTFEARARQFLREHCKEHRQARETGRLIDKELLPAWRDRRIDEITSREIKDHIKAIKARSPSVARNTLTIAKAFFAWACDEEYIEASPAAMIRPEKLIGQRQPRQRILSDTEIKIFWEATAALGYPFGDLGRLLLLTGVRLREAAHAKWSEIVGSVWTIPPERFKSNCPHIVPLSDQAMQLIDALPRRGEYLFTINGRQPVNAFAYGKKRLDQLMGVSNWRLHDLRRTMRTGLASLQIPDMIGELAIGHGKGDVLQRTYNLYQYQAELRDALQRWSNKVRDLTEPPPPNVLKLSDKKRRRAMLPPLDPDFLISVHDPAQLDEYATDLLQHWRAIREGKPANGYGVGMVKAAADWLLARMLK
jgi:integrase